MPTRTMLRSVVPIAGLLLSMISVILIWRGDSSGWTPVVSAFLVVISYLKQLAEQKVESPSGRKKRRIGFAPPVEAKQFRLAPSFESGLYGGLIGGGLSGLIIGTAYYLDSFSWDQPLGLGSIFEVFVYASLVGAIVGALSQLAILWFRYLASEKDYSRVIFNEVTGGILGGAIAGILVGAMGGWVFGMRDAEPVDRYLLLAGAIVGSIPVVVAAVFYEYQGRLRNVGRTLICSIIIAPFAVGLGLIAIYLGGLDLDAETVVAAIQDGMLWGLTIGIMLGLQIGLVLMIDRLWKRATK